MTLENWLVRATKCLSAESRAMARAEIMDHYEASCEQAIASGATPEAAEAMVLRALGDPASANRLYRRSLLTVSEAKFLREGKSQSRFICSHPLIRGMFLALPVAAFLAGLIAFVMKADNLARFLLPAAICLSVLLHGPLFPVYTPVRSRIYRVLKWAALSVLFALIMLLGRQDWLIGYCLGLVLWIEWRRFFIRRKLPISQWPRHLYL